MEFVPLSEAPLRNLGVLILPSVILGTALAAATMRMTRTMMLEVLRQDYIRTAWAKGLRERIVVLRHAVKNALIPVVSLIGLQGHGSGHGEDLPGLGRLMTALEDRDTRWCPGSRQRQSLGFAPNHQIPAHGVDRRAR